jgi:HAE1 family hydrophobic/amphiphilic exporter-1
MGTISVVVFGVLSLERLPIELLPNINYPTLTVQTRYADAAPVSVEQLVTRPVEEAVGVIPGVRDLRSVSRAGVSEVVLELEWGEDVEVAAIDVREKLGLVELPKEAEPSRVLRYDPSLDPILRLALSGDRPLDELRRLSERWIKPRLEAVQGVAAAKVRGGAEPEILVLVDEEKLAARGLTGEDVARALQAEDVNAPGGALRDQGAVFLVRTLHEFTDTAGVARTVVRERPGGERVRVEDVAEVRRGHRDPEEVARVGGHEAVELALHREGSANTISVARDLRAEVDAVRRELPAGLALDVLSDQASYVEASIEEVWTSAVGGGLLAVLVLYFFLRDPRPTIVIALTIPISVAATFLPLRSAGVSLNVMSLGGLALGVGMLVDCSIVVLEAIDRRRRQGLSRFEAACRGATEVSSAVISSTLTTVAVFVPIVFVRGVAGQLFRDLAVTVCVSLVASLTASLTLIPALAALDPTRRGPGGSVEGTLFAWDRTPAAGARPWTLRLGPVTLLPIGDGVHLLSRLLTALLLLPRLVLALALAVALAALWLLAWAFHVATWPLARAFDHVGALYPRALRAALAWRGLVIAAAVAAFFGAVAVVPHLGTDLVPDLAQGEFAFRLRLPEGTPLATTADVMARVEAPLLTDRRFARVFSIAGSLPSTASGRQTLGENLAQLDLVLAPAPDGSPPSAADELAAVERVREVLARFPQLEAELAHSQALAVKSPVAVLVHADELELLDRGATAIGEALARVPGLRDVSTTVEPGSPEVRIELDRERAGALGVQAEALGVALRRQVHGEVVAQLREEEERIDVRLRTAERFRDRASRVEELRVRLPDGQGGEGESVPVSAVASVEVGRGPAAIHRENGSRVARVTAQADARDLGGTLTRVREAVRGAQLPGGATAEMAGQDEELEASLRSLQLALGLAVFLVFVVMAMQFESLVHPFVILLTVPLGVTGVVAGLWATGSAVSVLALMGTVVLAGIVVNNGIVLVDAINRRRAEGEPLEPAILAAGVERLRPILMTTGTTVLGLLPMALGFGAGAELRRPLAVSVVAGLSVATLLTLLVIPCIYRVLALGEADARPDALPSDAPEALP